MGWLKTGRPGQLRQRCTELLCPRQDIAVQKPAAQVINSPLFKSLTGYVQTVGRCNVLDLGPAFGGNVAFFGELHCKLQIADCATALVQLNAGEDLGAEDYATELQRLLPIKGLEPFDIIQTWDLLNYLNKTLFAELMKHLLPCVSGDTWLHAYISSRREMPASPQRYRLDAEGRVMLPAAGSATHTSPCYSQQTLRTLMPRFNVCRVTLLQDGMQEYLFKGQGQGHR